MLETKKGLLNVLVLYGWRIIYSCAWSDYSWQERATRGDAICTQKLQKQALFLLWLSPYLCNCRRSHQMCLGMIASPRPVLREEARSLVSFTYGTVQIVVLILTGGSNVGSRKEARSLVLCTHSWLDCSPDCTRSVQCLTCGAGRIAVLMVGYLQGRQKLHVMHITSGAGQVAVLFFCQVSASYSGCCHGRRLGPITVAKS